MVISNENKLNKYSDHKTLSLVSLVLKGLFIPEFIKQIDCRVEEEFGFRRIMGTI